MDAHKNSSFLWIFPARNGLLLSVVSAEKTELFIAFNECLTVQINVYSCFCFVIWREMVHIVHVCDFFFFFVKISTEHNDLLIKKDQVINHDLFCTRQKVKVMNLQ